MEPYLRYNMTELQDLIDYNFSVITQFHMQYIQHYRQMSKTCEYNIYVKCIRINNLCAEPFVLPFTITITYLFKLVFQYPLFLQLQMMIYIREDRPRNRQHGSKYDIRHGTYTMGHYHMGHLYKFHICVHTRVYIDPVG